MLVSTAGYFASSSAWSFSRTVAVTFVQPWCSMMDAAKLRSPSPISRMRSLGLKGITGSSCCCWRCFLAGLGWRGFFDWLFSFCCGRPEGRCAACWRASFRLFAIGRLLEAAQLQVVVIRGENAMSNDAKKRHGREKKAEVAEAEPLLGRVLPKRAKKKGTSYAWYKAQGEDLTCNYGRDGGSGL